VEMTKKEDEAAGDALFAAATLRGKATTRPPDPERARALVESLSEQQVRDWLTAWGCKTASWRPEAHCRAFLAYLLGKKAFESFEIDAAGEA